jgi:hypothetical protein
MLMLMLMFSFLAFQVLCRPNLNPILSAEMAISRCFCMGLQCLPLDPMKFYFLNLQMPMGFKFNATSWPKFLKGTV